MNEALDYEIVWNGDQWEVWTPDTGVGACIGTGKTKEEAWRNTHVCLLKTALNVLAELYDNQARVKWHPQL